MATLKEEILALLAKSNGLTDREITDRLKGRDAPQQPANQAGHQLEVAGVLTRRRRDDGLIGNYPTGRPLASSPRGKPKSAEDANPETDSLSEDAVKELLVNWLEAQGWKAEVAWGQTRGIDIDATRGQERWIIEVKGCGSRQPMRVNYFLAVLGETLQRMDDPAARYAIALPDMAQYRGLWERLPRLAKDRTDIGAMFVSADGNVSLET